MTTLWITGFFNEETDRTEICGVFTTAALALEQCTTRNHWLGPMELDKVQPVEPTEWVGHRYPIAEQELEAYRKVEYPDGIAIGPLA